MMDMPRSERSRKFSASWLQGCLGIHMALAGCNSSVSPGSKPAGADVAGKAASRDFQVGSKSGSGPGSASSKSQAKVVSTIEGDRMTVVGPVDRPDQADRIEPVSVRGDRQGMRASTSSTSRA